MSPRISIIQKIPLSVEKLADKKGIVFKIFMLALALRIAFTLIHPTIYLITDMLGYNEAGMSLLQDGELRVKGVVSASRPPVYPYFLMLIYWITGQNFLLVRLAQALIGALTVIILIKIGEEMFDRRVGILAGLIYALYPPAWAFGDFLLSENLFTFLMLFSILCLIRMFSLKSPWTIFAGGLFAGLATLTRTVYAPYLPFLFVEILIFHLKSPKIISRFALALVIFIMTIFPWMLRNYYTHKSFTLNTKSGVDLYQYNHNSIPYIIKNYCDMGSFEEDQAWKWDEVYKGKMGLKLTKEWVIHNPHLFLLKGVRQIMNIWGFDRDYHWYYIAGYYGSDPVWLILIMVPLMGLPFVLIAPLSVAGFFTSRPFSGNRLIPTLTIICLHLLTFAVYGFSRHRFPFAALLIIWAAYAIMNRDKIRSALQKGSPLRVKTGIIFAWCFLVFAWGVEIIVDLGALVGLKFFEEGTP